MDSLRTCELAIAAQLERIAQLLRTDEPSTTTQAIHAIRKLRGELAIMLCYLPTAD